MIISSLHSQLLEHAKGLVAVAHPKQVELRRAVSAAYYAVFHLIVHEAVTMLLTPKHKHLRAPLARAFSHTEIREACDKFKSATEVPFRAGAVRRVRVRVKVTSGAAQVPTIPVPSELRDFADAFSDLQEARHRADYDVGRDVSRDEAKEDVKRAEDAFADWIKIQGDPAARAFLLSALVWKSIAKRAKEKPRKQKPTPKSP